ncbi:hypothetical protein [Sphingobium fluviale]|uniref:Uncharacterized protein n=1 Tax=Sphingobium fluviale TaxID=2506423 RepID=A0A4Q1KG26_9SPHN|nr:hypothetical protein [Sphingobium fluviale]RXR28648.1 hypothetical protein EQG66_09790 [Sphingobium fluviale]
MANEVATIDDKKVPAKAPVQAGGKLAAFVPSTLDEAWRLSGALAASGMTPKSYGNDQNKIMVGIMAGAEVGLTPFAALQSIAVIGNNPSLWGDGALALVQASGLLVDMEETDDGNTATCRLVRVGRSTPIVRTFSMEEAKKAGLAGKAGPWTQYPARMRQMRARAFALRDGFSDVLKGLHIVEEVRDYTPFEGEATASRPALTSAMLASQAGGGDVEEIVEEGRSDEQHGDQHDGTEASPEDRAVSDLLYLIYETRAQEELDACMSKVAALRGSLPSDKITELDAALDAAEARILRSQGE